MSHDPNQEHVPAGLSRRDLASTAFSVGSPIYWVISRTQTVSTDTTTCREMQVRVS
jgi:hypothetical protein